MQTNLSWPMHTPANYLDERRVLLGKALELQFSNLPRRRQRAESCKAARSQKSSFVSLMTF
jgi:hypothetical protein